MKMATTAAKNEREDLDRLIKDLQCVKKVDSNMRFQSKREDDKIISSADVDIEDVKRIARSLWIKRVGVLVNQPVEQ